MLVHPLTNTYTDTHIAYTLRMLKCQKRMVCKKVWSVTTTHEKQFHMEFSDRLLRLAALSLNS